MHEMGLAAHHATELCCYLLCIDCTDPFHREHLHVPAAVRRRVVW